MTVNVQDIRDYITWKQNQNSNGIQDSVEDFAAYRERLEESARIEETIAALREAIIGENQEHAWLAADIYTILTGTEFEADDV